MFLYDQLKLKARHKSSAATKIGRQQYR